MLIRHPSNPVIDRTGIPKVLPGICDVSSVFNPAAVMFNGQYLLVLRVQNRARETFLMKAISADGINFEVEDKVIEFNGLSDKVKEKIYHVYDARITKIENTYFLVFAMDMENRCALGIAKTYDFEEYDFVGLTSEHDTRNGVLFPELIDGYHMMLERPNSLQLDDGPTSGNSIYLSRSKDLINWEITKKVLSGNPHYWDERIGSGPPPIKIKEGWLHIYHGIATHFGSSNIYQAGVLLLDLKDPSKVIARSKYNILEPREYYELCGQVPNVVFPSGMIVESYDKDGFTNYHSNVKIYYGAADTSVAMAEATVKDLIDACNA